MESLRSDRERSLRRKMVLTRLVKEERKLWNSVGECSRVEVDNLR